MGEVVYSSSNMQLIRSQSGGTGRGAKPDPFYKEAIDEFLSSTEESVVVVPRDKLRLPQAIRQGLNMALNRETDENGDPLSDTLLVSMTKETIGEGAEARPQQVVKLSRRSPKDAAARRVARLAKEAADRAEAENPDPFFGKTVEDFLASGDESLVVEEGDRKPAELRRGLNLALQRSGLKSKVLVSLVKANPGDAKASQVVLTRRK